MLLWQQLFPGDLVGTSRLVSNSYIGPKLANPRDGASEKEFFLVKTMIFCHCDRVMHRIHQKERQLRTNKFLSWYN